MKQPGYDKAFEDYAWEEMRRLLDAEMPVRRRRRLVPLWWLFGSGAVVSLLLALAVGRMGAPSRMLEEPSQALPSHACDEIVQEKGAPTAESETEPPPPKATTSAAPSALATPPAVDLAAVKALSPTTIFSPMPMPRAQQPPPPRLPPRSSILHCAQALPMWDVGHAGPQPNRRSHSLSAQGGTGSHYAGGISWARWRDTGARHRWRWGYGAGYRYRRSRTNGLTILRYESGKEELSVPNHTAIAGHFRNWHLAEGFLFSERQMTLKWWVGVGLQAGVLLYTGPTGSGLLANGAGKARTTAEPAAPFGEGQGMVAQGVAPLQLSLSGYLRYQVRARAPLPAVAPPAKRSLSAQRLARSTLHTRRGDAPRPAPIALRHTCAILPAKREMLACQKDQFELEPGHTYLNCAYLGPLSRRVLEAGRRGLQLKARPHEITTTHFFEPCSRLRATFAQLIEARQADDVAILPSVSYGLAIAAANIPSIRSKNKIVLLHEQFPSNYYCWARLARRRQWELVAVKAPAAARDHTAAWNEALLDAIDAHTAVVAMAPTHWATGTTFDLGAVAEKVHRYGAFWILDATQYLGAHPFSVHAFEPDAVVAAGYKFLMGPYGIAFGWYGTRFHGGTPIEENWANRLHSDDFSRLVAYQPTYRPRAQRFNMGEQSNFITIPMMQAALEQICEWRPENIQDYCRTLVTPHLERLRAMGIQVQPSVWHLFGLHLPKGVDVEKVKDFLARAHISVSVRGKSVRVSPSVYNTPEDMEKLTEVLRQALQAVS